MAVVIILSVRPLNDIQLPLFPNADKLVHFSFYGALVALLSWGFVKIKRFNLTKLLLCAYWCILLGSVIELIQHYLVEGRSGDWLDFVANTIGTVFVSYILYRKYLVRRKEK